ncbi:putative ABC transporter ATP-binding protein [Geobacter sp. OR-1]|uniref:energy-coupling factor ABC transporter ATP-binding protein n=1 Tax=Geobacter sp. OR-1 TaxID=1266765 RepID=UPI0005427DD6|nr:ABC transporter ATP-binding protein [Geobacter sp. OR-1]GAM09732.1 putative ABC transporter ATP-binding protein [Geobacter sp. OR-1]
MSHHIVEVKNLRHTYPDGTVALKDISFRITHGESVGIIGANGAGKSTLLLHLNGYLTPTSGTIRIGDFPLTKGTLPEIRRTVGMVFQDPDDQLFMPTVFEDVAFGPLNLGFTAGDAEQCVMAALARVDATHLKDKPPYHLSGGEKKRVAIATVLSMSPDILVMDEPTNGLDPFARRQLMGLMREFQHTRIITSHDLDMVVELCSRVIVLKDGEVRADGLSRDIFGDHELLAECRLEKPLSMQGCPVCSGRVPVFTPDDSDHHHHHDHPHDHHHSHHHKH